MKKLVLVLILVAAAVSAQAFEYMLTDLGYGEAFGINDSGQITGWRPDPNGGSSRAFLWSQASGFVDIGPSTGRAINQSGQVAGDGWRWDPITGLTELQRPGDSEGSASLAINDSGQIAGWERLPFGYTAVVWESPESLTQITDGWARDVNNSNVVVGEHQPMLGQDHAFMWSWTLGLIDIGSFGTPFARADGINDLNQVVGQYQPDGRHAFIWDATGGMTDLGTLGGSDSHAVRINNRGEVVGNSMYEMSNPATHAFMWEKSCGMVCLSPSIGSSAATDINGLGQIVGTFRDSDNREHIALWSPIVPEPSGLLALGMTLAGLAGFMKRKK